MKKIIRKHKYLSIMTISGIVLFLLFLYSGSGLATAFILASIAVSVIGVFGCLSLWIMYTYLGPPIWRKK